MKPLTPEEQARYMQQEQKAQEQTNDWLRAVAEIPGVTFIGSDCIDFPPGVEVPPFPLPDKEKP